jgi:hypothetical protein
MMSPYNSSANSLNGSIGEFIDLIEPTGYLVGVPFATDMGGIGSQAYPRDNTDTDPLIYPFETEAGVMIDKQKTGNRIFDLNNEGLAHYGLVADHIQDIRTHSNSRIYESVMNSTEAYLQMWERALANDSPKYSSTDENWFSIVNRASGRCMDIPGNDNNLNNGSNVQLWDCQLTSQDQKWRYDAANQMFRNKANPEKCLDNRGQAHNNGGVVIWDCLDSDNLRWTYSGNKLASKHNSNIVADAFGTGNDANVGQWSYHGGANQQWELRLMSAENRYAQYRSESTGQCISATGGSHTGALVAMAACDSSANQLWRFDTATGLMVNGVAGAKCLEVPEGLIYDHTLLQLADCDANNPAQQFNYAGKLLRSRIDSNQVLDVSGGNTSTLIMYGVHGGANQRWHATANGQ